MDTEAPPGRRGWLIGMAVAVVVIVVGFVILAVRDDGGGGGGSDDMPGMEMGRGATGIVVVSR